MTLRPLRDQVLVRLDPIPTLTAGGLHLPEAHLYANTRRPDARWGTVLAAGPGRFSSRDVWLPTELRPGMRVAVNAWQTDAVTPGHQVGHSGDVLCREADVFMVQDV